MSLLACNVRGCGLPLDRRDRRFVCARGHSFDVARHGYVNLLQPQDRRSKSPGDSRAAVDARATLLDHGIGRQILDQYVRHARELHLRDHPWAVELGSGGGELMAALVRDGRLSGIGIDLSIAAAERAARAFADLPQIVWVVANVDRRIPVLSRAAGLVCSFHARRHPVECARVLAVRGTLLVAVPAEDDLIELRTAVQGAKVRRDRTTALIDEHEHLFRLAERSIVRERHRLTSDLLQLLLRGTYRGARASAAPAVEMLGELEVTLASEILVFEKRVK